MNVSKLYLGVRIGRAKDVISALFKVIAVLVNKKDTTRSPITQNAYY